jgi:hypothetical protein
MTIANWLRSRGPLGWLTVESLHVALRHAKLINQHGVSDGADDGDLRSLRAFSAGLHSLPRPFLVWDMGEPNLRHADAATVARRSDQNHIAA